MSSIEDKLEVIAQKIASQVEGENVVFKDRLDAFKALTAYQFNKNKPKKPDADSEEDTFNAYRERVAASADRPAKNGADKRTPIELA